MPQPNRENFAMNPVIEAICNRRSAKAASLEGPAPDQTTVEAIITAGAAAPDHGLLWPFRFVEVTQAARSRLADAFEAAARGAKAEISLDEIAKARDKAERGPLLLALVGRFQPNHPKITLSDQWMTAGGALQNMVLAAESFGLAIALRSGSALGSAPLRAFFGLQEGEELLCFLAIGKGTQKLPDRPKPVLGDVFRQI
jgi:nitroreductase